MDVTVVEEPDYTNVVGQDSLNRFEHIFKKKNVLATDVRSQQLQQEEIRVEISNRQTSLRATSRSLEAHNRKTTNKGNKLKSKAITLTRRRDKTNVVPTIEESQTTIITMNRSHKIWLSLFLLPLLIACSEAPMFEKVYSFDNREWKQDQKMKFEVDIQDTSKIYDFTVLVRTTTDYKYNNLWMFMKTIAPDGTTGRDPIQLYITNPDGSWVGTKSGSVVETPLYFKSRKMPMKGKYTFVLEQGITDSKVTEILDLILRVDYARDQTQE